MAGAGLGTAEGRITVDASQALSSIDKVGSALQGLDGKTAAGGGMSDFNKNILQTAQGMQNLGRVGIGLGAAMSAPFVAGAKAALDFDQSMTNVNAVMDLTQEQFDNLSHLASQLGADTIFSGNEAAQGIETLGKAGISYEDIMNGAAQATADLAAAGGTDIPAAAEVMSAAMAAFNIAGEDSVQVADALAGVANASLTDIHQLSIGLGQVGGVAAAANMDLTETVAFLGLMADNGVRGSDAATSMKTAILALLAPTDTASALMDSLGISLLDTEGNFIGLQDASQEFYDAWKRSGQSMAEFMDPLTKVLGRDAVRAILFGMQAIEDGANGTGKGFEYYNDAANDAGAASEYAEKRMDSTAGALEKLRGSIVSVAEQAFLPLIQALQAPIEMLDGLVDAIGHIPTPILAAVAAFGSLAAAAVTVASGIALVGGHILEGLARIGVTAAGFETAAGMALRFASTISLVVAAVLALKAAYDSNFLGFADAVNAVLDPLNNLIDRIKEMQEVMGADGSSYKSKRGGLAGEIEELGEAIRVITGLDVTGVTSKIADLVQLGDNLGKFTSRLNRLTNMSDAVTGLGKAIDGLGMAIDLTFGTDFSDAFKAAADAVDKFLTTFGYVYDDLSSGGASAAYAGVYALGAALDAVFGSNGASDRLFNLAQGIRAFGDAWQIAADQMNPAELALFALSEAARAMGNQDIATMLLQASKAAYDFGNAFDTIFSQDQAQNVNGLSSALHALNEALFLVTGIDLSGVIDPAIAAINAFTAATQRAAAQGLGPLDQALAGVDAVLDTFLPPDMIARLDQAQQFIEGLGVGVRNLLGAGLARVGQLFGEIGTAISTANFGDIGVALGSFATDIKAQLDNLVATVQALDIPSIVVNIGEFIAGAIPDLWEAVKSFFGFGSGYAGAGGPRDAGPSTATAIDIPSIAVNIASFVRGEVADLWAAVKGFFGFGDSYAGANGPRDAGPSTATAIDIPSIAVNIASFTQGAIADLWATVTSWFGFGSGGGQLSGSGDFTGGGGVTLDAVQINIASFIQGAWSGIEMLAGELSAWVTSNLAGKIDVDSIKVNISNFIQGTWTGITELASTIKSWIDTNLAGNTTLEAVKVNISNFIQGTWTGITELASQIDTWIETNLGDRITATVQGVDIELPTPTVTWEDAAAVISALNEPLKQIEVSEQFVADAEAKGRELGKAAADALVGGLQAAFAEGSAGGYAGEGGPRDMGPSAPTFNFEQALAGFTNEFVSSFQAALEPHIAAAEAELMGWFFDRVGEAVVNILNTPLLPSDIAGTSPVALAGGFGQDLRGVYDDAYIPPTQDAITGAASDIGQAGADAAAEAGPDIIGVTGAVFEEVLRKTPMGHAIFPITDRAFSEAGAAAAEGVTAENLAGPTLAAIPGAIGGGASQINSELDAAVQGSGMGENLPTTIDNVLASNIGGATLEEFSRQIGQKMGEAITQGLSGGEVLAIPGSTGSSAGATIGDTIGKTLADSIMAADFATVGTAIQTKISEAVSAGMTGEAGGGIGAQPGGAGGGAAGAGIGSSVASALATSITGADFAAVGSAIQAKISEALTTGLSGDAAAGGQQAGAAAGGSIGTSIATSLAASITGADFSAVGAAIQAKISEAVAAGQASAGRSGTGMAPSGGGSGIGASIADAISGEIAGADFSAVGAAISAQIGASLGTGTAELTAAMGAVVKAVSDAGVAAATQAQTVGSAIGQAIGNGVSATSGFILSGVTTAVQGAISAAQGIAASAQTVGSALGQAIGNGVNATAGFVSSSVTTTVQSAISAGTGAAAGGQAVGATLGQSMGDGVSGTAGYLSTQVTGAIQAAIDAGMGMAGEAYAIGAAIIQGIAQGVTDGTGILTAAVTGAVRAGIDAARQAGEIQSPSKVFDREVGVPIAQGMAEGVRKGGRDLNKAIRDVLSNAVNAGDLKIPSGLFDGLQAIAENLKNTAGMEHFGAALGALGMDMEDAGNSVNDNAQEMIDTLTAQLNAAKDKVSKASKGMGKAMDSSFFESLRDNLGEQWVNAADLIGNLEAMESDVSKLMQIGNILANTAGFESIGQAILDIAANIEQTRSDALANAQTLLTNIEELIEKANTRFHKASKRAGKSVGEGIADGMRESKTDVSTAATDMATAAGGGVEDNMERLKGLAEQYGADLGGAMGTGMSSTEPVLESAGEDAASALGTGLETGALDAGSKAGQMIQEITNQVREATGQAAPEVMQNGTDLAASFVEGVSQIKTAEDARKLVTDLHSTLTQTVQSSLGGVKQTGSQLGGAFAEGLDSVNPTQEGKELATEAANGIKSGTPTGVNTANRSGTQIGDSVATGLESACAPVNDASTELTDSCVPDGITAGEKTATKTAQESGQSVADSLMKGMELKKGDVKSNFDKAGKLFGDAIGSGVSTTQQKNNKSTVDNVKNAGQAGQAPATQAGKATGVNLGKGIGDGIDSQTAYVQAAVKRIIDEAKEEADKQSKSKSPSRLFMEVGRNMALGVAVGFQDHTNQAVDAAGQMVWAINDAMSGVGDKATMRIFDRGLDGYEQAMTGRLGGVEQFTRSAMASVERLDREAARTLDRRNMTQMQARMEDNSVGPTITVGSIELNPGDPGYDEANALVEFLSTTSGQYRGK